MRTVACIVMLAGCALAGRLENTYLPPPGAAQAGGSNLATPFSAPQNNYLPPSGSGSALRGGSAGSAFSSGSSFSSGSAFNSGSTGFNSGNAFNSGSSSFNSGSKSSASSFGAQQSLQAQNGVNAYSGSFQQPTPRPALIIKQVNENPGDGSYTFSYETENGIQAQEQGQIRADGAEGLAAVQGAYAFTAPDNNQRYTVTYTADENGFLAYGDHLPTPPPVPAEILRALEQNAADEARGVVDDGQYRAEHHGAEHSQQQSFNVRGGSSSSGYGANTGFGSSGYSANKGSGSSGFGSNSGSGYGANSGFGSSGYSANKGSGSSGFGSNSGSSFGSNSGSSFGSNSGSSFGSNSGSSFGSNSGSNSGSSFGSNSGSSSPSSSGFNNNNKNTDNGYHY